MLLNSIFLAISSSIDSLGIGITYGVKNTKISNTGKFILFFISFSVTLLSLYFGNIIKNIFSDYFSKLLGSIILILMGFFIYFQALKSDSKKPKKNIYSIKNDSEKIYSFFIKFLGITIKIIKNPINSDLDHSKSIDSKEAFILSLVLSLDSFCIGIGGSIIGINYTIFPFLISIFQLFFLNIGNLLGKKIYKSFSFPNNIWSVISGIVLILVGIMRFF